MKLISWNVNGIRAAVKKGLVQWLESEDPDVLCFQETKATEDQIPTDLLCPLLHAEGEAASWKGFWESGVRRGYSGVGTLVRKGGEKVRLYSRGLPAPFGEERFQSEGRVLITDHEDFLLLNIYFPNGQKDQDRLNYKLDFYDAVLACCEFLRRELKRSLILCGDFNTAHQEIDLARPKENENVSGFLRVERDWMDRLESCGYEDTFRRLHPDSVAYSWWSMRTLARERNLGWRLDYFYVSPDLLPRVKRAEVLSDVQGSDHCPVLLELD